jgi:hypothetical protein
MATTTETKPTATVVPFATPALAAAPEKAESAPKAFEKLWGKAIGRHGYAAIPAIMVRAQHRLGVNPTQFCILVQLLEYWRTKDRAPFPTKQQLADRIGVGQSTIQQNMRALEQAGLIKREQHKTTSGDWGANTYHLDGLVAKLIAIEPDFQEEKVKREALRRRAETPKGKRKDNT